MSHLSQIESRLPRSTSAPQPVVVMTCGIAGSGKSTLSHAIVSAHPHFTRLSIDATIHRHHGIYGVDYPRSNFEAYLEEAAKLVLEDLRKLLLDKKDVVLDLSFWSRDRRMEYKAIIEGLRGRWVLVYFEASREVLERNIRSRREKGINADSAFEITEEVLDRYMRGFEKPAGEGEIVIRVE